MPSASMGLPMFSQSKGQIPFDPVLDTSLIPSTSSIGDWAASAAPKYGTPSFMQDGFVPGDPAESMSMWDTTMAGLKDAFGTTKEPGWATGLLGAGQGLLNGWLGMKQYGLAKDKLAESKRQFELNYNAQQAMTNADLEDRQRARVASNANAYESVGSYMDKHGVKGLA
jgi:hypothetical protein